MLFPLAYILGDILTEIYGYKYTRRAIWAAFGIMLLAVAAFTVVRYMPASPRVYRSGVVRSGPRIFPEDSCSQLGSVLDWLVSELVCIGEIES